MMTRRSPRRVRYVVAKQSSVAGFSLTEVLVVMAVVLVLVGISIPVIQGVLAKSRHTECVSNLRQIGSFYKLYLAENRGECPPLLTADRQRSWRSLLAEQYIASNLVTTMDGVSSEPYELFWCPAFDLRYTHRDHVSGRGSYSMNWFFDTNVTGERHFAANLDGTLEPLVIDGWPRSDLPGVGGAFGGFRTLAGERNEGSGNYHPGNTFNALYLDGHVENLSADEVRDADAAVRVRATFE